MPTSARRLRWAPWPDSRDGRGPRASWPGIRFAASRGPLRTASASSWSKEPSLQHRRQQPRRLRHRRQRHRRQRHRRQQPRRQRHRRQRHRRQRHRRRHRPSRRLRRQQHFRRPRRRSSPRAAPDRAEARPLGGRAYSAAITGKRLTRLGRARSSLARRCSSIETGAPGSGNSRSRFFA